MTPAPKAGSPGGRLVWIDMARGFCVMAVVLLHVGLFHVFPLSPDSHGRLLARVWVLFNTAILADLRMPLLLLLSGFLARGKVRRGLGHPKTRLAVLTNLHLYVVWTLVFFALGVLFFPTMGGVPFAGRSVPGLGASLLYPQVGPLWFVYVLFVSLTLLALTRRFDPRLVWAGFFVLGWAVMAWTGTAAGLPRAVFFAAGALFGERLIALTRSRVAATACLAGYAGLSIVVEKVDPVMGYPVTVAAGLCAAVAFLAVAQSVARIRFLSVPGAWVGRRTLGIYVLHWPLVAAVTWAGMSHPDAFRPLLASQMAEVVYPIVLTVAIVGICLALEALLKRIGLGVLFDPPTPLKRWVTAGTHPEPGDVAADPGAPDAALSREADGRRSRRGDAPAG